MTPEVKTEYSKKYAYAAWVLHNGNRSFKTQLASWSSKAKANTVLIITVLYIARVDSQITIYTNNRSTTKQYKKLMQLYTTINSSDKETNWPIWNSIKIIIMMKRLNVKIEYSEGTNYVIQIDSIELPIALNYHELGYIIQLLK